MRKLNVVDNYKTHKKYEKYCEKSFRYFVVLCSSPFPAEAKQHPFIFLSNMLHNWRKFFCKNAENARSSRNIIRGSRICGIYVG